MVERGEREDRTRLHPSMRQIQTACSELRQAWRAHEIRCLEDFLDTLPYEVHGALLQALVACEMDLRRAAGHSVDVDEYRQRFANHTDEVEAAHRKTRHCEATSTVGVTREDIESENTLVRVLDDYLADLQQGKVPDKATLLAAHPSIAGPLEACLAGIDFVHRTEESDQLPNAFGRYAVQETLGRGAFGLVFLARDTELNRLVALKVPTEGRFSSPGEINRFIEEARTAAQLEHPGIVTVYDVFQDDQRVVIVQQYVQGQDLRRHLEQSGPMNCERAVELAIGIADAIGAAHKKGIVHRDLKPGNILLDDNGQPHVADFGLAVHKSIRGLSRGDRSGTPQYMSPEQVRGELDHLDERSDIWSLGVVLYEMLTGRLPFDGELTPALFDDIEHKATPSLCKIRPDIPGELERICLKCLSKQVTGRYAQADDLADELRQFIAHTSKKTDSISIAVLPFADASLERDQDYFCDGITEELTNRLARVEDLRVVGKTSVQKYLESTLDLPEIGRKLNVKAVLKGAVRKAGGQLRITAELVNASDGCQLWSDRFDREVKDIFAIQGEIAYNIVRSLELTLSAGERRFLQAPPTRDVQAYDYYLRGRKFLSQCRRKVIGLAQRMFSLAIKHDANYGMAYAGIADCYCFLALHSKFDPENLKQADEASLQALNLAPDSPEAHTSRGNALSACGRHDEAEAEFEKALQLGPHLFDAYYLYARDCFARGKLEKAIELYQRACELNPQDYQAPLLVAQSYDRLGRTADADAARRRGIEIAQERLNVYPDDVRPLYMGANALLMLGEIDKSLEWSNLALSMEPDEPLVLYNVACVYSLAGMLEEAMEHLEGAVRAGLRHGGWLEHDDNLDPLREHPRFQALLKEIE